MNFYWTSIALTVNSFDRSLFGHVIPAAVFFEACRIPIAGLAIALGSLWEF